MELSTAHAICFSFQYCCDQGMADVVKFLLEECGADPNCFCPSNPFPPLVLAAYHGYYKVLEVFKNHRGPRGVHFSIRTKVKRENVFHQILKGESKAYLNVKHRLAGTLNTPGS